MAEEWFTYQELGDRLGVSPEAARQKAIRGHWPRRTANDGKAQVRVDIEDVKATTLVRKPKDEHPADDDTTVVEHPSDALTFTALEAHIETLKGMVARAEAIADLERERATAEQARADRERDRADAERVRMDSLMEKLRTTDQETIIEHKKLEVEIDNLKSILAELHRPWWKRLVA